MPRPEPYRRRPHTSTLGWLIAIWPLVIWPSGAVAQTSAQPAAQALFDQGRALMQQSRYEEACPKLAESQRLEPAVGTLLNLALCHEQIGKTATAYVEYNDALALSLKASDEARIALARQRIALLEPRLSRLIVTFAGESNDRVWVTLDGTVLGASALDSPIPVDLGRHTVQAGAPGKRSVSLEVTVDQTNVTDTVQVPELEDAPAPEPDTPPAFLGGLSAGASSLTPSGPTSRAKPTPITIPDGSTAPMDRPGRVPESSRAASVAAGALMTVGSVGLALGTYFGLSAMAQWKQRNRHCPDHVCDAEAVSAGNQAKRSAVLSNSCFAIGVLGTVSSAYLFVQPAWPTLDHDRSGDQDRDDGMVGWLVTRGVF